MLIVESQAVDEPASVIPVYTEAELTGAWNSSCDSFYKQTGLHRFWERMGESSGFHGQPCSYGLCGSKTLERHSSELWCVQCGLGTERAAKKRVDKCSFRKVMLGIERDLREEG